jgi:hypothetical protein
MQVPVSQAACRKPFAPGVDSRYGGHGQQQLRAALLQLLRGLAGQGIAMV